VKAEPRQVKRKRIPTPAVDALRNPRLYVLGGKGGSINFSTVERFDPVANAWDGVDSMQSKRRQPAAAVLDGHLYVAGGYDSRDSPTATVESFNSTDCIWSEVPSMMTERAEHAMAVLPSGKPGHGSVLFVLGGVDEDSEELNSVEYFDGHTNSWKNTIPMSTRRCGHCAAVIGDTLFALGGYDGTSVLSTLESFTLEDGFWRSAPAMATGRKDFAVAVLDGELFVMGGQDDDGAQLDSVERYDPNLRKWQPAPSMHAERCCLAAVALEGEIYAIGGRDDSYSKLATVERFVPRAGAWVQVPPMEMQRSEHAAAVMGDRC
jgi:N-acetylneuraminic acid mutarotase